MKVMFAAFAAIVVIAAVAGVVLESVQQSTADRHTTSDVRLN